MRIAAPNAARPSEVDILTGFVYLLCSAFGQFIGHIARIYFHKGHQRVELVGVHLGSGETGWLALKRRLATGRGQDVRVGGGIHDGDPLLLFVERVDQLDATIVFAKQSAQALARSLPHFGGIGAEEARCIDNSAIHHREVLAEMVSLDAVAPGSTVGRSTEHREVIFLGIATLATIALDDLEHVFQAHDGHGFDVARLAQTPTPAARWRGASDRASSRAAAGPCAPWG